MDEDGEDAAQDSYFFHKDEAMSWETCAHQFSSWFGPVLKCQKCGATTMACMDKGESKPIFPPVKVCDDIQER